MEETDEGRQSALLFEPQADLVMQLSFLRGFLLKDPALCDAVQECLYALIEYLGAPVGFTPDSEIITGDG